MFKKLIINYYGNETLKRKQITTLSYTENTLKRLTLREDDKHISFNGGEYILISKKSIEDLYQYIHSFFFSRIESRDTISINVYTEGTRQITKWEIEEVKI